MADSSSTHLPPNELAKHIHFLPHEIIQLILEHLAPDAATPLPRRPVDLARCCLVSSTFRQLATPALYRRLFVELPVTDYSPWNSFRSVLRDPQVSLEKIVDRLKDQPDLQQHPRNLFLSGARDPWVRVSAFGSIMSLLSLLPRLASLDLHLAENPFIGDIALALPRLPLKSSLQHLSLKASERLGTCDEGVRAALRSLEHLQDLELLVWLRDDWEVWANEHFSSQIKQLSIGAGAHIALLALVRSSPSSLRTLTLELTAGPLLHDSSFTLTDFPRLTSLSLINTNPTALQQLVPQLSPLTSLLHLTIDDPSPTIYPPLTLATSLPTSVRELDLDFQAAFSDVLDLAQDTRFDGCRLSWLAWSDDERSTWEQRAENWRLLKGVKEAMKERSERKWERSFPFA